jgi:hypothetical protein
MSQISPPLRILLVGSIVFLAAWFAFLRPGDGSETASTPSPATTVPAKDPNAAAQSAPGKAVQSAVEAKDATEAAQAASSGEAPAPASTDSTAGGATAQTQAPEAPATGAPAKPGEKALSGLPMPVLKAVADHKVLVMLFWNPKAADDRAVRKAVKGIGRHHGKVSVHVANVKDISRYAQITRGVDVQQSPSVVVVDRKLRGDLLTGYVDRVTIEQAVSDALRAN